MRDLELEELAGLKLAGWDLVALALPAFHAFFSKQGLGKLGLKQPNLERFGNVSFGQEDVGTLGPAVFLPCRRHDPSVPQQGPSQPPDDLVAEEVALSYPVRCYPITTDTANRTTILTLLL